MLYNNIYFRTTKLFLVIIVLLKGSIGNAKQELQSENLFNGKDLEGWTILDPPANVSANDGCIVLKMTTHTSRHAFVRSNKKYKNFILELYFKRDKSLDSGILFRAVETPSTAFSSLYGYMVKIDPSPTRLWTGGLFLDYGNAHNWLKTLEDNEDAKNAENDQGAWNKLRVEAIGSVIKIWLNEVPSVHVKDDKYIKGYIAFKIHYLRSGDIDKEALTIAFKNITLITKNIKKHQKLIILPLTDTRLDTEKTYFR